MYIYFVIEINLQIHKKLLSLRRVSGHSRFVYALNENEKAKFLTHFPYISLNREEDSRHFYFQRRLPMKKILVFLFAFLLLVECIRVTGLFRRLLQRHSPWGQGEDRRPLPRCQSKSRLLLPHSHRLRRKRRRLGEDLHAKVTARGRGYHLRHLSRETLQHPISSRSTSRISP